MGLIKILVPGNDKQIYIRRVRKTFVLYTYGSIVRYIGLTNKRLYVIDKYKTSSHHLHGTGVIIKPKNLENITVGQS